MSGTTDFGFEQVRLEDKALRVRGVFDSVSSRYDLMNDLMSLGTHRLWKRFAVLTAGIRPGERVLDVAGGTGDLTRLVASRVGREGAVFCSDVNAPMLRLGRDRLIDQGLCGNIHYVRADAERLPFADGALDAVLIAFGLRNATRKEEALSAMYGVLRAGGRLVILEFSQLVVPLLQRLYDLYSFNLIPLLGQVVAGDRASYQYLVESIRRHPDQETLRQMMEQAGFELTSYYNLSAGVVAVHRGYKL